MLSAASLLAFALLIFSVSSDPKDALSIQRPMYEAKGIFMVKHDQGVTCLSHRVNSNPGTKQYSGSTLESAAVDACSQKNRQTNLNPKKKCPRVVNFVLKTSRVVPGGGMVTKKISGTAKKFGVKNYEGGDFQAHYEGDLILGYLDGAGLDDMVQQRVVIEWVGCRKICIVLGAVTKYREARTPQQHTNFKPCTVGMTSAINTFPDNSQQQAGTSRQQGRTPAAFQRQNNNPSGLNAGRNSDPYALQVNDGHPPPRTKANRYPLLDAQQGQGAYQRPVKRSQYWRRR